MSRPTARYQVCGQDMAQSLLCILYFIRYILNGLAKEVDLTEEEIDEMIADIDEDGNGEVSFEGKCVKYQSTNIK